MMIEPANVMIALGLLALAAPALRLAGVHGGMISAYPHADLHISLRARPHALTAHDDDMPATAQFSSQPDQSTVANKPVSQIARLEQIVSAAVDTARKAEHLHVSAHAQVDAADYALQGLRDELSSIMASMANTAPARLGVTRPARAQAQLIALAA